MKHEESILYKIMISNVVFIDGQKMKDKYDNPVIDDDTILNNADARYSVVSWDEDEKILKLETITSTRWIETDKRLPQINDWCFFWYGGKKPTIGCYKGDGKFLCSEDDDFWIVTEDNITHWMPLPKSPTTNMSYINNSTIREAIYLLTTEQPDNCPNWIENIGDCNKPECKFCRIQHCINELEKML